MSDSTDTLDVTILTENEEVTAAEYVQLRKDAHCSIEAHLRLKNVLEDFEAAASGLSSPNKVQIRMGIGFWVVGQVEKAVETLEAARSTNDGDYFLGLAYTESGRYTDAIAKFESVLESDSKFSLAKLGLLEAQIKTDLFDEAKKLAHKMAKAFADSPDYHCAHGNLLELQGFGTEAMEAYETAVEKEPGHPGATFRMANILDRFGEDVQAMELYEQLRKFRPTHINTAMNLGTLYEDRGDYAKAMECYQAVLDFFPMHRRARLYLNDARAAVSMFYDEDAARREAKMKQVLMQPVSEISCSPRVRAAMTKIGIHTIGDLAGKAEEDFLSVPNFGRTSLREIKEILTSRGLKIVSCEGDPVGEAGEGASPAGESGGKRLSEMEWSGRIGKLFENLNFTTVGDLLQMTEADLLKQKNLGMTSIKEIRKKLGAVGVSMREE